MQSSPDTIAAIATPPGKGGIGVIRVSGTLAPSIAEALVGHLPEPRLATLVTFREEDGAAIDQGLILFFPGTASFTGEPVLEVHGHGGGVVMDLLLQRVLSLGARPARAGEFTERAFLNDKIDLAQAEAVADLIDSVSEASARSAVRSLSGDFSACLGDLTEQLIELRVYIEAAIDFPEEEIDFLADESIVTRLNTITSSLDNIRQRASQGAVLREGVSLAIVGPPNAGKSSLMNRLSRQDIAIVNEQAGTTRDILREQLVVQGIPIELVDTAGIRSTSDAVEREGVQRALAELARADIALLVFDQSLGQHGVISAMGDLLASIGSALETFQGVLILVMNKKDLVRVDTGWEAVQDILSICPQINERVSISAATGEGLERLFDVIAQSAGLTTTVEGVFMARRRHLVALDEASARVRAGQAQLAVNAAGELLAEELREAQRYIGEITGDFTNDDLLGRIFSSFCIGK